MKPESEVARFFQVAEFKFLWQQPTAGPKGIFHLVTVVIDFWRRQDWKNNVVGQATNVGQTLPD